ncbi:MAG: GNAT family N-acetyltransferase [Herpetosiphon sp.]
MLRGTKTLLRALERTDMKRLWELEKNLDLALWAQPDWMPKSLARYEQEFDKRLEDRNQIHFAIEADGTMIGGIGIIHQHTQSGVAEFGMAILEPAYVGNGYGRDAINVFVDWAFRIINIRRLCLQVLATNERAIRAYRACGFQEEARLREHTVHNGAPVDVIMMGLLRAEWQRPSPTV